VASLARVRLGIDPDLKITGPLFDRLQSLKEGNALRLVSREPRSSTECSPYFQSELLEKCDLLGLSLTLQSPVKARLIRRRKHRRRPAKLVARIRNEPQRLLKLRSRISSFTRNRPRWMSQGMNVQVRFDVPENSARLLLQRLAKIALFRRGSGMRFVHA